MKLANIAEAQLKTFSALQKRFAQKPSRKLADGMAKEAVATRIAQIEQRIDRLERHKKATLARIETSLGNEYEALAAARREAEQLPIEGDQPKPAPKPRKTPVSKLGLEKAEGGKRSA